jgi:hypothetical protein
MTDADHLCWVLRQGLTASGITSPRKFVFMDRVVIGRGSLYLRLRAEFS